MVTFPPPARTPAAEPHVAVPQRSVVVTLAPAGAETLTLSAPDRALTRGAAVAVSAPLSGAGLVFGFDEGSRVTTTVGGSCAPRGVAGACTAGGVICGAGTATIAGGDTRTSDAMSGAASHVPTPR
jgi:hypothetical protein